MKSSLPKIEKIGTIAVDSGNVTVGDPCYILKHPYERLVGMENLELVIGKGWVDKRTGKVPENESDINVVPYGKGKANVVTVPSGFGDGEYDVFAIRAKTAFGERVMGLFVDFGAYSDGRDTEQFMAEVLELQAKKQAEQRKKSGK